MKHYRTHYETVYGQMLAEVENDFLPITRVLSNFELMTRMNVLLFLGNCIQYTAEELFEISESME